VTAVAAVKKHARVTLHAWFGLSCAFEAHDVGFGELLAAPLALEFDD